MRIIIDVDGDIGNAKAYLDALNIDIELIHRIAFEDI